MQVEFEQVETSGNPRMSFALRNASNALNFWILAMREVRQLPRFKAFVREIGHVDYWSEFGWPDICRPVGAGDLQCN
jgi:hypothetical protein